MLHPPSQVTDRLDIVRSVLDKRAAPELPHGALMRLARLLGLTSAADIAKVHTMMAQSVLDYPHRTPEDVVVAAEMCVGLVRQGHVPAWRVCASLAHTDPASLLDPAVRQEMLGFALAHCDGAPPGSATTTTTMPEMVIFVEPTSCRSDGFTRLV